MVSEDVEALSTPHTCTHLHRYVTLHAAFKGDFAIAVMKNGIFNMTVVAPVSEQDMCPYSTYRKSSMTSERDCFGRQDR